MPLLSVTSTVGLFLAGHLTITEPLRAPQTDQSHLSGMAFMQVNAPKYAHLDVGVRGPKSIATQPHLRACFPSNPEHTLTVLNYPTLFALPDIWSDDSKMLREVYCSWLPLLEQFILL